MRQSCVLYLSGLRWITPATVRLVGFQDTEAVTLPPESAGVPDQARAWTPGMSHPASKWTKGAAMVWWRRRRRQALHPPRRFRVYADLISPVPDAETKPVLRPAAPPHQEGERS